MMRAPDHGQHCGIPVSDELASRHTKPRFLIRKLVADEDRFVSIDGGGDGEVVVLSNDRDFVHLCFEITTVRSSFLKMT